MDTGEIAEIVNNEIFVLNRCVLFICIYNCKNALVSYEMMPIPFYCFMVDYALCESLYLEIVMYRIGYSFFPQKHLSMTCVLLDIDIIHVVIIINGEILMISISGESCEIARAINLH